MFRFKLEALLRLKKNEEDRCKRNLAQAYKKQAEIKQQQDYLNNKKNSSYDEMQKQLKEGFSARTLQHLSSYLKVINQQEKELQQAYKQASDAIDEAKEALKEAIKEKKVMENLKARHAENYNEELKKEEQKKEDEIISFKYTKKGEKSNDV